MRTLFEQGINKSAIARQLGLDIKTVRKWIKQPFQPQHRKRARALDQYAIFLKARAPKVGFNAAVLLREVQDLGYRGSYPVLLRYIRPCRLAAQATIEPTVRFETDPGQQAQVDWGSTNVVFDAASSAPISSSWCWATRAAPLSKPISMNAWMRCSTLTRRHSRTSADAPTAFFYDTPRTIVLDKDEATGQVVWNPIFKDRMDFYGVGPRLCRYYRAQTKGKVESGVKYVKRNALIGANFP